MVFSDNDRYAMREAPEGDISSGTEGDAHPAPDAAASEPGRDDELSRDGSRIYQKGTEELAARVISRSSAEPRRRPSRRAEDSASARSRLETLPQIGPKVLDSDAPVLMLLCGSPRKRTSVSLADLVERGAMEAGVRTSRFELSDKRVHPCIGCGVCERTGECVFRNRPFPGDATVDDYDEFVTMLDSADGLAVFAPVYFAGPSAQLKAVYDRFQPYWSRKYLLGGPFPARRPSQLFVIGSGGDPHGYEPLTSISKSALQISGFELEKIYSFVGYLAPSDVPVPASAEEVERMRPGDLEANREAMLRQEEMRYRAVEAGRAFGRMLRKEPERWS